MSEFLRFVVETKLDRPEMIPKETTVAMEVFGRGTDFDPRLDTIVRVQAVRLRSKLLEHYATEGADDLLRIDFPAGSYVPVFREEGPARGAMGTTASGEIATIAILPFADLSPEKDQGYFCDGITEEILHLVAQSRSVRVAGRTSSFAFRDREEDVRRIGEALGVEHLLEGSICKWGQRIRVSAQLLDGRTGFHFWSETFDRELTDLFVLQDELAGAITARLLGVPVPVHRPPAPSLKAHDLCLVGRHEFNKQTIPGLQRAGEIYQQAADLEPGCVQAWGGLAECLIYQAFFGCGPPRELMGEARKTALQAIALDPDSEEGYLALGAVAAMYDMDLPLGLELYRRALVLNPSSVTAHTWLSYAYECMEDLDAALDHVLQARRLDPLSPIVDESLAFCRFLRREYEESNAGYRLLLDRVPNYPLAWLGIATNDLARGDAGSALTSAERARAQWGDHPVVLGTLGMAQAMAGRPDQARDCLALMEAAAGKGYVSSFEFALVHIGLAEHERALDRLEHAFEQRGGYVVFSRIHPLLDPLRSYGRFKALIGQLERSIR